ncbi:unnamed protein product, partial [Hapterophycus canaliculatus]
MAEPEISAGSVTVFKDSQLLRKGTFGTTYAAEYLGMPVSATILPITTSDPMAAVWSAASARLLRRSATSELRSLASLVPPHPRLARTYGNESVTTHAPLRVVNNGATAAAGQEGRKEEEPVALVLVGEMVDGGSLRGRIRADAAAAATAVAEKGPREGGAAGDEAGGESAAAKVLSSVSTSERDGSEEDGVPSPEAPATPQSLRRRRVLADVAQGLAYLHERGVSHGALASENVLLDAEGRAKLWLFGLAETRKAVEAFKLASVSASEEWDALPARAAAPPVIAGGTGSWTAPEAWLALAGKQAAAAKRAAAGRGKPSASVDEPTEKEGEAAAAAPAAGSTAALAAAEALESKKQAAFAADAYAFGMVAWEVLTGAQPWEGLELEEVSSRVCRGERPPLSFEAISLEGLDGFGDLVRLLWAQDPTARPALQDVARLLRVPEPQRPPVSSAAEVASA